MKPQQHSVISTRGMLIVFLVVVQSVTAGYHEKRLLDFLFDPHRKDHHNPLERPVMNDTEPLEVMFKVSLQQIIDVDEKNQILHTNIWLDLKWIDYHFRWDPTQYGNISKVMIPPNRLWRPDILMYNSADDKFDGTYPTNIVITSNGGMLYVPPGMFKSTCSINITWFPFDEQVCELKFGSWTYDGGSIDLKLQCPESNPPNCTEKGYGDTDTYIENGEWDLIAVIAKRNVAKYECCPNPYIDIVFAVHIRRRALYYTFNLVVPCMLISTMALLVFLLPSDAGEKISLGMYFACIMFMCSLSVVFTVLVLNYHHSSADGQAPPKWVRTLVCKYLAIILCMTAPDGVKESLSKASPTMPPPPSSSSASYFPVASSAPPRSRSKGRQEQRRTPAGPRGRTSKRAHRNGGYTLDHLDLRERSSKSLLANVLDLEDDIRPQQIISAAASTSNGGFFHATAPPGGVPGIGAGEPGLEMEGGLYDPAVPLPGNELLAIIRELQMITAKLKQEEVDAKYSAEWKFAARVVDRFCLVFFTFFTIISTCAILFSAPNVFSLASFKSG